MWKNFLKDIGMPENSLDQIKEFISLYAEYNKSTSEPLSEETSEEILAREFSDKMSNAIALVLDEGILFKDALGLSDENMEAFYAWGYECFMQGKYKDALLIFKNIIMIDPTEWKYHYALATTLHKQKNFQEASDRYLLSSIIDPSKYSPFPHYHRADCFLQMNDIAGASIALHFCLQNCNKESEEHSVLFERAHILKQAMDEKLSSPLKG